MTQHSSFAPSQHHRPEILAPAGTIEAFMACLEAGADAVYVGLKQLNARALATNFTIEQLYHLRQLTTKRNVKLFVALNSLVKQEEIPSLVHILSELEAIEVDAIIIQDLGLWRIARCHFPGLRLHASTLMTIHNSLGVRQAYEMGFKRVVLAREMTLKEIEVACKAAPIEVEVFIHGALCFSYSGLCLFSSFHGGMSSMRGRCVQPCRRLYSWGGKKGRFFSMSDLSALELVWDLAKLGVTSLKIEGRLRHAGYVSAVVRAYRLLLDSDPYDKEALRRAKGLIDSSFGRETTKGYFLGRSSQQSLIRPQYTANTGILIGTVTAHRGNTLFVDITKMPNPGDRLRLVHVKKDQQIKVRCLDVKTSSQNKNVVKISVKGLAKGFDPQNALVFLIDTSKKTPIKKNLGKSRLAKRPLKQILQMAGKRAEEVLSLMEKVPDRARDYNQRTRRGSKRNARLWVKIPYHIGSVKRGASNPPKRFLVDLFAFSPKDKRFDGRIVWCLPPILHEARIKEARARISWLLEKGFKRFQVAELGQIRLLKEVSAKLFSSKGRKNTLDIEIIGDYTLNILNSQAVLLAKELGLSAVQFSIESDSKNLKMALQDLKKHKSIPVHLTAFSFPPMFTTRMNHPMYKSSRPVVSTKGEKFYWKNSDGVGRLIPEKAYCILERAEYLHSLGVDALIVDLSLWPRNSKMPRLRALDLNSLKRSLWGKNFNFDSRLF